VLPAGKQVAGGTRQGDLRGFLRVVEHEHKGPSIAPTLCLTTITLSLSLSPKPQTLALYPGPDVKSRRVSSRQKVQYAVFSYVERWLGVGSAA
jgi:hypothetical protein